jgi:hypothetical protein
MDIQIENTAIQEINIYPIAIIEIYTYNDSNVELS